MRKLILLQVLKLKHLHYVLSFAILVSLTYLHIRQDLVLLSVNAESSASASEFFV